jgi:transcriptional regulator with XRE-family HTH domain
MPKPPTGSTRGTGDAPGGSFGTGAGEVLALFGENFRLARLGAGLTQRDIEARTGLKQTYVSEVEGGKRNLTLASMVVLAEAVGTDVRALLAPAPPAEKK